MVSVALEQSAQPTTLSLCWCGSNSVEIPISWVGHSTGSCTDPHCVQGCEMVEVDAFDLTDDNVAFTLEVGTDYCVCGCGEPINVKRKRRFRPGHDGRVKGWIAKAGKAGQLVAIYDSGAEIICTANEALAHFGWPPYKQ